MVGNLSNTAITVMDQAFWIGVYPGITDSMVEYTVDTMQAASLQLLLLKVHSYP